MADHQLRARAGAFNPARPPCPPEISFVALLLLIGRALAAEAMLAGCCGADPSTDGHLRAAETAWSQAARCGALLANRTPITPAGVRLAILARSISWIIDRRDDDASATALAALSRPAGPLDALLPGPGHAHLREITAMTLLRMQRLDLFSSADGAPDLPAGPGSPGSDAADMPGPELS